MFLNRPKTIEDIVLNSLFRGPIGTIELIREVSKLRKNSTKQGVYKILRELKNEEIIVVHNKQVSLNVRWLKKINNTLSLASNNYLGREMASSEILNLKEGEKISYTFHSPTLTDSFWLHAVLTVLETLPVVEPIFLYNPHDWFLIARRGSEKEFMDLISKQGRQYLMTTGSKLPLDRAVSEEFDGDQGQYYMRDKNLFNKNNYYVNIFGDYILEVWVDKKTTASIENLYETSKTLNEETVSKLSKIINQKGKSKVAISKNKIKAEKIKKMLSKHFYVKQSKLKTA